MKPPHIAAATVNLPTFTPSPQPSRTSLHYPLPSTPTRITLTNSIRVPFISYCLNSTTTDSSTISPPQDESSSPNNLLPPVKKKRKAYRRLRPGEAQGITEEMRFVAMKLREKKLKLETDKLDERESDDSDHDDRTWEPELDGFLRYLVDSEFVFRTVERMVDESQDVSCKFLQTLIEYSLVCLVTPNL
ncbi:putative Heme oxygenase (biliverdin-producing) [Helianthus annuus]|nr:putative Heme oxygenase (biliverdin-producing) [Helianthus annuus]